MSRIFLPSETIVNLVADGNRQEAEKLLEDVLRLSFINSFMDSVRKIWVPGCHEGSQGNNYAPYKTLCSVITEIAQEEIGNIEL